MSPGTSAEFAPLLREVGRGLAVPLSRRVRILRELSADLESFYDHMVADGVPPEEARRRAAEAVVPDREALDALTRVHTPWYERLTRPVSADRVRRLERGALVVATVAVMALETATLVRIDLLGDPSPFLWPVLVLGAALFVTVAATAFRLRVARDPVAPRRGLGVIAGISATILGTGLVGVLVDFYRLAAALERTPHRTMPLLTDWLVRDGTVVCVALILAVAGALAWFGIRSWVLLVEAAESEVLGSHSRPHPPPLEHH